VLGVFDCLFDTCQQTRKDLTPLSPEYRGKGRGEDKEEADLLQSAL
jgi:hypothetical protein